MLSRVAVLSLLTGSMLQVMALWLWRGGWWV